MNNNFVDILRRMTATDIHGNPTKTGKLLKQLVEAPAITDRFRLNAQLMRLGMR